MIKRISRGAQYLTLQKYFSHSSLIMQEIFLTSPIKLNWDCKYVADYYPSTLATSTLIILFTKMLKISKTISSKSKNIVEENSEYLGIFHLLKWIFKIINYSIDMCWNGQGTTVIINHLDPSLWVANQKQGEAVRSNLLFSSLEGTRLCCGLHHPQRTGQNWWAKSILLSQRPHVLTFLHPILISGSHTEHCWTCSKLSNKNSKVIQIWEIKMQDNIKFPWFKILWWTTLKFPILSWVCIDLHLHTSNLQLSSFNLQRDYSLNGRWIVIGL